MDLYNKLLKCGIFRANPRVKNNFEKKKTLLDPDTSAIFENGVALGKYLLVLKDALQIKNQNNPATKLFNWNIISSELDVKLSFLKFQKIGISVDVDNRSLIVAGDQEQILTVFTRVERFLVKIAGKQILNFDGIKIEQTSTIQQNDNQTEKSNARRGNKPNQKKVAKDGVDILTMNAEREPIDTESTLELILNTLCRAFQMKPKQAAALLTNNNQFLIHSIVKGVKGKYEPLISWYQDLYANSKHLTSLLEMEIEQFPNSTNLSKVLATLSCGLYSHNLDICKWCSKLLTKIGYDFGASQKLFEQAMSWFLEREGGLELSLHALKKHQDLAEDFVAFVTQFSSVNDQVEQVYKNELKKYFSSPLDYVNAINDLFPFLVSQCSSEVRRSGILDFWVESCLKQADNDGKHSYDERIAALTLLAEIWLNFTDSVDQKEDITNQVLQMLKRGARDKYRPIRTVSICGLFRLLDKFAEDKNNSAPSIYKTLIFSLVENPNDSILRELYYINFISLYETQQTIPVGLLIDPLVKQIQVTEGVTFFFEIFDFDFFALLAKHPKLNLNAAIQLADLLAKIYLNNVTYSSAASVPFTLVCSRFINDEQMQEFILKFETICFSMLMGLEKNAEELQFKHQQMLLAKEQGKNGTKKLLALPAPPQPPKKKIIGKKLTKDEKLRQLKEQDEDVTRRLKKSHIVEITLKIQNLRNEDLNEQMRDMLLSTNKRFNELYGFFNKGIMALLKWWGDPESIMHSFIRAIEEREAQERAEQERKEREERERIRREQEEKERKEQEERDLRQKKIEEKMKMLTADDQFNDLNSEDRRLMLGYDSAGNGEYSSLGSKHEAIRNSMAVLPYTGAKTQTLRNQKALQEIEKIKRNKIEKEEQKRLEEERQKRKYENKNKKLREQLEKRKLELGIGSNNTDSKALIYKDGSVLSENDKLKRLAEQKLMIPQIKLIDLEEEEERDKEAITMLMKKYAKLWRNLFYKYCNSGFSSKQIYNFDQFQEKSQMINVAEVTKMLKDHSTFPSLINKQELTQLFRLINTKMFSRSDLQALDYSGYHQFIVQLAFFCFTKPPKDLSHMPPVECIRALVNQFEQATRERGNSTVLYDDPDSSGMGDSQLIKALNAKLLEDPSYPIPEGYFKQLDKTPIYEYRFSDQVSEQLPESLVVSVEVFDELLNELFGFHVLEPLVSFEERLKVRPMIKNLVKPQAEALNYMKKVEKRVKPQDKLNPYSSLSAIEKQKMNQEVKPIPNITLKLEVAKFPLKERPHAQEVAEVLEEIMQAAEKGLDHLPPRLNRAPGQVWNEAKQKQVEDKACEEQTRNLKEEQRKKRDNQLKSQITKIKESQNIDELRKEREEKDRQEKENQKRQQEEYRRKLAAKRQQLEDQKNEKMKEVLEKRKEEEEKNKEQEEKKKRERTEFMKKQKLKLEDEFSQAKKDREELATKQQELQQKEKEFQLKIKANMENFIQESKQDRIQEHEERKQIADILKQPDIENVFALYDKSLRHMFKFYASQDKKDLDFNMDRVLNTMNFREFIRFSYQQYIVPCLMPPEDAVKIFRQLIREMIDEKSQKVGDNENYLNDRQFAQVLDYDLFKKSLLRIGIMAGVQLGGLREEQLIQKLEEEGMKKRKEKRKEQLQDQSLNQNDQSPSNQNEESKQDGDGDNSIAQKEKGQSQSKGNDVGKDSEKVVETLEISETQKKKEDAFFDKWVKEREAKGISLKKRIIGKDKDGSKKVVKKKKVVKVKGKSGQEGELNDVREGEDIEDDEENGGKQGLGQSPSKMTLNNKTIGGSAIVRKTKALKALKELEQQQAMHDTLAMTKIEHIKVRKDLDFSVISPKTIIALMKFLGIEPEDSRQNLDNKLNQHRIEIQGQKPNKIKKQIMPNSNANILILLELDEIKIEDPAQYDIQKQGEKENSMQEKNTNEEVLVTQENQ